MLNKKIIINADGFGINNFYNQAVLEGYINGFLTSAGICVNTKAFDNAVNNILPDCPDLSVGVNLNITLGKSLTNCLLLTDNNGNFNSDFLYFLFNSNKPLLLEQIEQEFRAQVEKVCEYIKPAYISSLDSIHFIPQILKIVCKLAKEYNIPYVRTVREKIYFVPKLKKHLNLKFIKNMFKTLLLNYFSIRNKDIISEYNIKTNDYIIGLLYKNMMDNDTIIWGLNELNHDSITECIVNPSKYENTVKDSYTKEFELISDKNLEETIKNMGFEITSYKKV